MTRLKVTYSVDIPKFLAHPYKVRGQEELRFRLNTSSPRGNDRSPESNVPRSNVLVQ